MLTETSEETLHFIIPPNPSGAIYPPTQALLAPTTLPPAPTTPSPVKWQSASPGAWSVDQPLLTIKLPTASGLPVQIAWHRRGDYLATVCRWL